MKSKLRIEWMLWGAFALTVACLPARADLQVAQIAPMSGSVAAADGQAYNLGIRVALDAAHARGGVLGQKVTLKRWTTSTSQAGRWS